MAWKPDYCTADELKSYVRVEDTFDDAQVALAITAASRAVDKAAGRQFGQVDAAEEWFYTAEWDRHRHRGRWTVRIDDLATETNLAVEVDGTTVTDFTLTPRNAVAKGKVWTEIVLGSGIGSWCENGIAITALWGWPSVPGAVKQATILQASRLLARRDSPFGVASSLGQGTDLRLFAQVDPDVKVSLGPYIRFWGAA